MNIRGELHPRTLLILISAGGLGSAAVTPYFIRFFAGEISSVWYIPALVAVAAAIAALSAAAAYKGLQWGVGLGLGAPRIQNWAWNRVDVGGWRQSLQWAVPISFVLMAIVYVAEKYWFAGKFAGAYPDEVWWQQIGAAIFAGTTEELLLRLFALTGIAKLLTAGGTPRQRAVIIALFMAALLSIAFHLPGTLRYHPFSWPVVGQAVIHSGLTGLVYGWLYWRRGLEAAMIAHGLTDLMIRFSI